MRAFLYFRLAQSGNGRKRQAPFQHGIKAGTIGWRCHD